MHHKSEGLPPRFCYVLCGTPLRCHSEASPQGRGSAPPAVLRSHSLASPFCSLISQGFAQASFTHRAPCLSLWERWPSAARTERVLPLPLGEVAERSEDGEGLASPFGRGGRAQRGRRGQTMTIPALSVTCGDSSPKGRAKGLHSSTECLHVIRFGRGRAPPLHSVYRICVPCGYFQRGRAAALPL